MSDHACDVVRSAAVRFEPNGDGLDALIERVGDARLVLIGEATHGTEEFYALRAQLTRALITQHGFNVVAVEADWPEAYRVNRFVRLASDDRTAEQALSDFSRFPRWKWRNTEMVSFLDWLREQNAGRTDQEMVGFYGLDLYSLHRSMEVVLQYLRRVDPEAAERARARYNCFEGFAADAESYGYARSLGLTKSCECEAIAQLVELRRSAVDYINQDGRLAADDYFFAEQNARIVKNAEAYYRAIFGGRVESWNVRETHMMETLETLLAHVAANGSDARAVVWAHNSHLGDARATEMGQHREISLGQLARERYGDAVKLIGFTTHTGHVIAASDWEEPARPMRVQPSLPASYEALFHTVGFDRFMLTFDEQAVCEALTPPRLERAIGVVYRPETERPSHYFTAQLPKQFDVVLHVDRTRAVEPLQGSAIRERQQVPYPAAV